VHADRVLVIDYPVPSAENSRINIDIELPGHVVPGAEPELQWRFSRMGTLYFAVARRKERVNDPSALSTAAGDR